MELFGVGAGEALLVLVITLIVVGPQRFPEIAREGGRWFRIARQFTAEITSDVRAAIDELEEEIAAEGDDLRSIREIGTDVETGLRESAADIRRIGRDTDADASAAMGDGEGGDASTPTSPAARRETAPTPAGRPAGPRPDIAELQRPRTQAEMQKQLADAYKGMRDGTTARTGTGTTTSTPPRPATTPMTPTTNESATRPESATEDEPPTGEPSRPE